MQDYDAYLFDMDGTIAKTFDLWLAIVRDTLTEYGLEADTKTIVRRVFGNADIGLVELGVPAADLGSVYEKWDKKAAQTMPAVALYPDITNVLAKLKADGKKLAVISASVHPTLEVILRAHDLLEIFDVVLGGDEYTAPKPDPEGIEVVLSKLDIPKSRAIMLGDSEKDVRAAHNAGIASILFYPHEHDDYHSFSELKADSPTYTIHSWKELLDQLQ